MKRQYTFVTVMFHGEHGLLRLQARSMRLFCPADLVREILIVDNSYPHPTTWWRTQVMSQYGKLAKFVRILSAAELTSMPIEARGWITQQILKLKIAESVRSDRYVVLDTKSHLVYPLKLDFLETATGLPRLNGYSFAQHPLRGNLERTLAYLGVDSNTHLNWFTRTGPPFTILTRHARDLVQYIESREGTSFASVFVEKRLAEFFLYSSYLLSRGILHTSYDFTQPLCVHILEDSAKKDDCIKCIRQIKNTGAPFMSVHRNAIAKMDDEGRAALAEFWRARGLFPTITEGIRFLRSPNTTYQSERGEVPRFSAARLVVGLRYNWEVAKIRGWSIKKQIHARLRRRPSVMHHGVAWPRHLANRGRARGG